MSSHLQIENHAKVLLCKAGRVRSSIGPKIVFSLTFKAYTKPSCALTESSFTTFEDVADRLANGSVFKATSEVTYWRKSA